MILLISNKWDLSVDFVVLELQKRKHDYFRLNTEDLSKRDVCVSVPQFSLTIKGGKAFDAEAVRVIWNRRPGKPYDGITPDARPSSATINFVEDQWFWWREAFQLLEKVTWINNPRIEARMESKARQLATAAAMGFRIPKTMMTNDPHTVREFSKACENGIIAKALFAPLIEEPSQDRFIFTTPLNLEIDGNEDRIRICPFIVQEKLPQKIDYRVTVVGEALFAVRIVSNSTASVPIDWRTGKEGISFELCELPPAIASLCLKYVRDAGLLFGAIDLLEVGDEFYFLELNPNGEWGWLQKPFGIPIAEALCDLMIERDMA